MITIRPLQSTEVDVAQQIYNHKDIISHLGGMTMRETIKGKIDSSGITIWGAFEEARIIGSAMIAGRNQCHYAKFGEVGVLSDYRRRRIASCLYIAILCQGIFEGRRIWEDTIVGNNPYQFSVLPTLGLEHWGILKKKTASFLDIHLFGYNLEIDRFEKTLLRIPEGIEIQIQKDNYTSDLWKKNDEIYQKKNDEFRKVISECLSLIENHSQITVLKGFEKRPHNYWK